MSDPPLVVRLHQRTRSDVQAHRNPRWRLRVRVNDIAQTVLQRAKGRPRIWCHIGSRLRPRTRCHRCRHRRGLHHLINRLHQRRRTRRRCLLRVERKNRRRNGENKYEEEGRSLLHKVSVVENRSVWQRRKPTDCSQPTQNLSNFLQNRVAILPIAWCFALRPMVNVRAWRNW